MAYLARIEPLDIQPITQLAITARPNPEFSALEWSIIRLARNDSLSTIREPGPIRRLLNRVIGRAGNPRLANDRLEALRRISVLSWNFGFTVPGDDVADFLTAGFTVEQYELLVSSVRARQLRPVGGEVLA